MRIPRISTSELTPFQAGTKDVSHMPFSSNYSGERRRRSPVDDRSLSFHLSAGPLDKGK